MKSTCEPSIGNFTSLATVAGLKKPSPCVAYLAFLASADSADSGWAAVFM